MKKLTEMTLGELSDWAKIEQDKNTQRAKRYFVMAKTAMGCGSIEEQLIRLMIWGGVRLPSLAEHSHLVDPIQILDDGNAWCDQHTKVFGFFAYYLLGIPGHEVAVHHCDGQNGHAVCEMDYGGAWHLFDPHCEHMCVYRGDDGHILNHAEILQNPGVVVAQDHWWKGSNEIGKEGFYSPESKTQFYAPFHNWAEFQKDWIP